MMDRDFARAVERDDIPASGFDHLSHLRLARAYLLESATLDEATARMRTTLHQLTVSAGKPEKYHETLTRFWMSVLARACGAHHPVNTLDAVLARHPRLLDKDLALTYYSRERLMSDAARRSWIRPDLQELNADTPSSHSDDSSCHAPGRALSG